MNRDTKTDESLLGLRQEVQQSRDRVRQEAVHGTIVITAVASSGVGAYGTHELFFKTKQQKYLQAAEANPYIKPYDLPPDLLGGIAGGSVVGVTTYVALKKLLLKRKQCAAKS